MAITNTNTRETIPGTRSMERLTVVFLSITSQKIGILTMHITPLIIRDRIMMAMDTISTMEPMATTSGILLLLDQIQWLSVEAVQLELSLELLS